MKRTGFFAGIFLATFTFHSCSHSGKDQKPTGLPGDNLDLYAVLNLFETSKSVEGFEKSLNDKSTGVNNLDLNGDGKVDYIRVIDLRDGDAHAITLRVPVSGEESQDAAVIEIEKTGDNQASIQIVGDETMYGENMIIEPKDGEEKAGFVYASSVGVNVYAWPAVSYVYSPAYVVYESPYYYDYYPVYWSPWEPVVYEVYSPMHFKNHGQYVSYNKHRFKHANEIYYSNRMHSDFVVTRHKNGEFKGGKQPKYKGNDFPKGNGGNDKHDGNGNNHGGNDGKDFKGGKDGNTDHSPKGGNDHREGSKGDNKSHDNSKKSSSPKGGNDHSKGGGNHPKGGGGKHK
ncbi:MAG: hypothetical protein ABIQ40_04875 [Bacteroidia bacterium]